MKKRSLDFLIFIAGILLLAAWIFLNLHNISSYPPAKGFDGTYHIDYIKFIQTNKSLPLPIYGWEMYHPPLYYLIMSVIPDLKVSQYFNFFLVIILTLIVFKFFAAKYKDYKYSLAGITFSLSIPVVIYSIPQINNEILVMFLANIGLIFYYFNQNKLNKKNCLIIGLIASLGLLTKYTGIIFLVVVIMDIFIKRSRNLNKALKPAFIIFLVSFLFSGWIYTRNFMLYKNPFISNMELFPMEQIPNSRDLSFLTNISAIFRGDYYNSRYYSLWGGIFYSFFHDEHNAIIPSTFIDRSDVGLLIFPIGIICIIFTGLIYTIIRKRSDHVFVLYFFALLSTFIYYCYKYPTNTSVKGIYLLSLILPMSVFGLNLIKKNKMNIYFLYGYLFFYFLIVAKNFWIRSFY